MLKDINTIQYLATNSPELVWTHYSELLFSNIWSLEVSSVEKHNLKQTFIRQAAGQRSQRSLLSINMYLKGCIEQTFPCISDDFFTTTEDGLAEVSNPIVQKMIEDFETLLAKQKAK